MNHIEMTRADLIDRRDKLTVIIEQLDQLFPAENPIGGGVSHKPLMHNRTVTIRKPRATGKSYAAGDRINHAHRKPARNGAAAAMTDEPKSVVDAIRVVIASMGKGAEFKGPEMVEMVGKAFPSMASKVGRGISVNLQFLVEKGEVKQDRPGKGCTYTVAAIKPPSGANVTQTEEEWRRLRGEIDKEIKVPRDKEN